MEQKDHETKHQFDRRVKREEALAAGQAALDAKYPGKFSVRHVRNELRVERKEG